MRMLVSIDNYVPAHVEGAAAGDWFDPNDISTVRLALPGVGCVYGLRQNFIHWSFDHTLPTDYFHSAVYPSLYNYSRRVHLLVQDDDGETLHHSINEVLSMKVESHGSCIELNVLDETPKAAPPPVGEGG